MFSGCVSVCACVHERAPASVEIIFTGGVFHLCTLVASARRASVYAHHRLQRRGSDLARRGLMCVSALMRQQYVFSALVMPRNEPSNLRLLLYLRPLRITGGRAAESYGKH